MAKLASPSGMLGRRSFYAKRHARLSLALPRPLSTCSPHLPMPPRTGAVSSVASSQPWTTRLSWKRSVAAPRHRCRACLSEFDRGQPGGMQNSANYEKNDAYLASLHCDTISIEGAPPFMILGPDGESKLIGGWTQKYKTDMFTSSQNQVNVSANRGTGDHPRLLCSQAPRRQSGRLRPSVCHAAGSRDAAGKHGALALVDGRCGDLGQSRDPAQSNRRLRRPATHRAPRDHRRAGVRRHRGRHGKRHNCDAQVPAAA